jgi:ferredoxin
MCGTCKTFKHSGEVTMAHEGGIRQREIDRGFILPCVSRPLTDIVLDC